MNGFSINNEKGDTMVISHLLFVDDTLIFCKDNVFQLRFLRCIFFCFKVEDQSEQIGIVQWVQFRMLRSWTVTLVVVFLLFPLGLPLGAPFKAKHIGILFWTRCKRYRLVGKKYTFLKGAGSL